MKRSEITRYKDQYAQRGAINTDEPLAILLDSTWTDEREDALEVQLGSYGELNRLVWSTDTGVSVLSSSRPSADGLGLTSSSPSPRASAGERRLGAAPTASRL